MAYTTGGYKYRSDLTKQLHPNKKPRTLAGTIAKIKNLRVVTPERAQELGIPAEAPMLCSPYIQAKARCVECNITYLPLIYQVGLETTAHHFCKKGGIFVQLLEDKSGKWVYSQGLFQAVVIPRGPIRMGNDRGYTFRSVTLKKMLPVHCVSCKTLLTQGKLRPASKSLYVTTATSHYLVPICKHCPIESCETEWSFRITDEGELHFSRPMTLPEGIRI